MPSTFLTAEWRKLIMAQYVIDPAVLAPWLPAGLELDFYNGQTFVSLVGFLFQRVRLKGIPIPFHRQFEEVNLRFYVRRPMPGGAYRRGVVFRSEIVPKPAITLVARALYGEAYSTAPTRHLWRSSPTELDVSYLWKHKQRWQHLSAQAAPQPQPIAPGSMEEFITEHYFGYTRQRNGLTGEYGVLHPRWECYPVHSCIVKADFGSLYGPAFAALTAREPDHVLLAEGSGVAVQSNSGELIR